MTIIVDSHEDDEFLVGLCDEQEHLSVDDGTSVDLHVEADDGTVFRGERKTWSDFVKSWKQDRLDLQVEQADFLAVEGFPDRHDGPEHGNASLHANARKHVWHLARLTWVVPTTDAYDTVTFCRYLEEKGADIDRVQHHVQVDGETARERVLAALPGINTRRVIHEDGESLGEALEGFVDWEHFPAMLGVEEWKGLPGIGEGTIENIREALTDGE